MKYNYDRVMKAKKTFALVSACSVSIDQAIKVALSSIGGTLIDVKLTEVDRHVVWRMKLLTGGRRVKMYIDARSGRVLEAKAEIIVTDPYQQITPETPTLWYPTSLESLPRL